MDDQTQSTDDEIRAQNAVLRLKLEMEHGMKGCQTEGLSPTLENAWLTSIQLTVGNWQLTKVRTPWTHSLPIGDHIVNCLLLTVNLNGM